MAESFSQQRMNRCTRIHQSIMENWVKTKILSYVVRATEPIAGLSLSELRTQYFTVGTGNDLTDVPFTDLLVVMSMIAQANAALRAMAAGTKSEGRIHVSITTNFSDEEAAAILSQMTIETPFDKFSVLRFNADEGEPMT